MRYTLAELKTIIRCKYNNMDHKLLMFWYLKNDVIEKRLYEKYKDNIEMLKVTLCNESFTNRMAEKYFNLILKGA